MASTKTKVLNALALCITLLTAVAVVRMLYIVFSAIPLNVWATVGLLFAKIGGAVIALWAVCRTGKLLEQWVTVRKARAARDGQ